MEPKDPKYTYFQPGELFFLFEYKNDRLLNYLIQSDRSASNHMSGSMPEDEIDQKAANYPDPEKPNQPIDQKITKLIDWSNQIAKDLGLNLTIKRDEKRELHYPGYKGPGLPNNGPDYQPKSDASQKTPLEKVSLVGQGYTSPVVNPPKSFSLIPAYVLSNKVFWKDNPDGYIEHSKLAYLIELLDDRRQDFKDDDIKLTVVSPNWLVSPTSEWGGGGGPGSRPVPYHGSSESAPHKFHFPTALEELCDPKEENWGKGVRVAILDTSPSIHELVWAYEKYHKVNPDRQRKHHPLIESLLKPGGPLKLHPASSDDLFRMRAVHLRDHNYNMTDHGLFVSGIIHTIAPLAEIHLYEVLNSEGVGDLVTIFNALFNIVAEQVREYERTGSVPSLVVNCSLVLNIPLVDGNTSSQRTASVIQPSNLLPIVGHRLTDLDKSFLKKIGKGDDWVERASSAIQAMCDDLYLSQSRVVAAAGNDWVKTEGAGRPRARYLAAFKSVQGVGALSRGPSSATLARNSNYEIAPYSDLSDDPSAVGVVTLGGDSGEGNGVLGVYIGEFPPSERLSFSECIRRCLTKLLCGKVCGPRNRSDWAWWAGTSFSTPVLTGAIAAVLSKSGLRISTETAISSMYKSGAIQNGKTSYKEDVLDVTQG